MQHLWDIRDGTWPIFVEFVFIWTFFRKNSIDLTNSLNWKRVFSSFIGKSMESMFSICWMWHLIRLRSFQQSQQDRVSRGRILITFSEITQKSSQKKFVENIYIFYEQCQNCWEAYISRWIGQFVHSHWW